MDATQLRAVNGRRLSIVLAGGSRIDDCEVISAGFGSSATVWLFSGGDYTFVPHGEVLDWSEEAKEPPPGSHLVAEQLTHALNSRVLVEQAKGVIAERTALDVDQAVSWMARYARRHNLPVTDVAQSVIDGTVLISTRPAADDASRPTGR
jgi:hypothetical protein